MCRRWWTVMILILLSSQMRRKERTRLRGSIGRPVRVVNTRSVGGQARAHVGPVGGLAFGLELEGLACGVQQRECAAPGVGLDRAEDELAADALDLLANMDGSSVEVDVAPVQAQGFAAS